MTYMNVKAGELVLYRTPQGQIRSGRAKALLLFPTHIVVDAGNGRPVVVNASNYVRKVSP